MSSPVEEFDFFISHTWMTPPRWKIPPLLLQSGCRWTLVCEVVVVSLTFALCMAGVLPLPWVLDITVDDVQYNLPVAPWLVLTSFFAFVVGLLSCPHVPQCMGVPDICFWEAACINQTDVDEKNKGIYAIADFLRVSKELRVLWSPPYLSRLWCVFELAAYRKANPNGRVSVTPVFVEFTVLICVLSNYGVSFVFLTIRVHSVSGLGFLILCLLAGTVPILVALHYLRNYFAMKLKLVGDLEHFVLDRVDCASDFDRSFIYGAIRLWYGSEEAFEAFVRGPLREELLSNVVTREMLPGYSVLVAMPFWSLSLDFIVSFYAGGLPPEDVLSLFFAFSMGLCVCWASLSLKLILYVCDRLSVPKGGLRGYMLTLLAYVIFFAFVLVGTVAAALAYRHSVVASALWFAFAKLVVLVIQRPRGPKPDLSAEASRLPAVPPMPMTPPAESEFSL